MCAAPVNRASHQEQKAKDTSKNRDLLQVDSICPLAGINTGMQWGAAWHP